MAKRHPVRNTQFNQAVKNVHTFFEQERLRIVNNQPPVIPHTAVRDRVAASLQISKTTVDRILVEFDKLPAPPGTPGKTRKRIRSKRDVDDYVKGHIRQVIYRKYAKEESVTISSLWNDLKQCDVDFHGSQETLRKLLQDIGFSYKKGDNNRKQLLESPYIAAHRIRFLRRYMSNKNSDIRHQVVFLDETWVYAKGSDCRMWTDGTSEAAKKSRPTTSTRYIILHAGTRNGFVSGASLIFVSGSKTGDYHDAMNGDNFELWVKNQLLPNLEEPSLIVMDNAPYHSVLKEKPPTQSWKKDDLITWLNKNNIPFPEGAFKAELLGLAIANKPPKRFLIDELIQENGHEVLRLPPYHWQYNPIEMVWSQTKRYYNKNIGRSGTGKEEVLKIWDESLQQVTPEQWGNYVRHAEKLIDQSWTAETSAENRDPVNPVVINLEEDTSEEESEESDDWPVPLE